MRPISHCRLPKAPPDRLLRVGILQSNWPPVAQVILHLLLEHPEITTAGSPSDSVDEAAAVSDTMRVAALAEFNRMREFSTVNAVSTTRRPAESPCRHWS